MIPAQPILIFALVTLVFFYFLRLRSKLIDTIAVVVIFGCASVLVMHPRLATRIATLVGVGRGVDLVFYIAIPGLAFLILLLFSKLRSIEAKLTKTIRQQALANAEIRERPSRSAKLD